MPCKLLQTAGMRSSRFLALAIVAAVTLAGCASLSPSNSNPPPAPQPSATASAEPEQQRETGLTRPAGVFGGQCDALFSDAELQGAMGESLSLGANHWVELWGGTGLVDQAGGLMCTWDGDESRVIALALPEAAVDYEPSFNGCSETHDSSYLSCWIDAVVNGTRLSAQVTLNEDEATVVAASDALLGVFTDKAAERTPVPIPIPAVGSWALPPDCVAVVDGSDFSAVAGLGAGATGTAGYGYGKDSPQAWREFSKAWMPPTCVILGEGAEVEFVPIGGSRWREEGVAARSDATVLPLDGIEASYAIPYVDGLTLVYAFDGPNMLMFAVRYPKNAAGIATALIASLDSTAVE